MTVDGTSVFPSSEEHIGIQADGANFVESRHVNTGYNTMNDSAATSILMEMNNAMFIRLSPAIAFLALLMAVGILGNLSICYIFAFKLGASTQNFLLLSIGVFDLLSCTLGIPAEILDMRHYFLFESAELCKLMRFCTAFPTLGSIQCLLIIAADRFRKVCRPLHGQIELKHARLAMVGIVILAFVFSVPPLHIYGHRTFPTEISGVIGRECSVNDKYAGGLYPLVYQGTLGGFFVISTTALSVIYLKIWIETKRHRKYIKAHTMPGDSRQDDSSSSEDECTDAEGGSRISVCSRRSALCRHVYNFSSVFRGRRHSAHNGEVEHVQLHSSPDPTSSPVANDQTPSKYDMSSTPVAIVVAETTNKCNSLQCDEIKYEFEESNVVQDEITMDDNGDFEFRAFVEVEGSTNSACRSTGACCPLHDHIQIGEDISGANEECETKIERRRSLPVIELDNMARSQADVRDRRNCVSEYVNKTFFRKEPPRAASPTLNPSAPIKEDSIVTQSYVQVQNTRTYDAKRGSSNKEEPIDENMSFIPGDFTKPVTNRTNQTFGTARYNRLNKTQSQYELSTSDSNSSLASQLSAPVLDSRASERRLLNYYSRNKLGRMVVSKNTKKTKSNPLFLQASNNLYKSRSLRSKSSEPIESRFRSQSDPPKSLYNSRSHRSRLNPPLSKRSRSKSNTSLTVNRVKKAFRATRTTVIASVITTAFVLSYLPHLSLSILRLVWTSFEHQLDGVSLVFYNIFLRSYFVNTAINIFVYGTMNREFRDEVNKIWKQFK